MSDDKRKRNSKLVVQSLMLGPAPVLEGEDSKAYNDLLMKISSHVNPSNIIEDLWVHDVVHKAWDVLRYRRYKMALLKAAMPKALEETLTPFMDDPSRFGAVGRYNIHGHREPTPAMELVNRWARRDPKAVKEVDEILASGGLTLEDVEARAFSNEIERMQQFDRLITNAEAGLKAILREIEYRRAEFSKSLRHATQSTVEAEFERVNAKPIAQKPNH